jgi:hypothetical protein
MRITTPRVVRHSNSMENDPRRRRSRGGRRRGGGGGPERPRPTRAPAEPKAPPPARGLARRDRPQRRRPQRSPDDLRPGQPCVIVMDCREGEPDRTGAAAVFEGFFDLETGDPRRAGYGVPRLRVVRPAPTPPGPIEPLSSSVRPAPVEAHAAERLWGFECWWRPDPASAGLTDTDRVEIEQSKKLLRGLLRDSRRSTRPVGAR